MQYQKRGYIKTYDEKGHLVSKERVGSDTVPVLETENVQFSEALGDE